MAATFADLAMAQAGRDYPDRGFYRAAIALAAAGKDGRKAAAEYARQRWGGFDGVADSLETKAPVASGTTANSPEVLAFNSRVALGSIMAETVLGRLERVQRVVFVEGAALATGGGTMGWVGEGAPTPLGRLQWGLASLPPLKAAGIIVVSAELARDESPAAEGVTRREIRDGLVRFHDGALLSDDAAVAGVSPAGILNGVVGVPSVDAPTDISVLLNTFTDADGVSLILSPRNLVGLAMAAPGAIVNGKLAGVLPLIASTAAADNVIALHEPSLLLADDGGIALDISTQASLIMDDDPNAVVQATGAGPVHTSMWQNNMVGLRALRFLNWQLRPGAVAVVTGASY